MLIDIVNVGRVINYIHIWAFVYIDNTGKQARGKLNQLLINLSVFLAEVLITEETVQSLLTAANLLQLNSVRDACCDFLQCQLHPTNCLGIQRFADMHDCSELLQASRRFTEQHCG